MPRLHWIWCLLIQGAILATDWPQWRGPNRDGVWSERGIVTSLPTVGPVLNWKAAVGYGFSSPIVSDGKVYLSDLLVEKPIVRERVLCFNARTGRELWKSEHTAVPPDWFFNPEQTRGPGSTPILHRGRVYSISMFFKLTCLDARSGKVLWRRDLGTEYQLPPSSLDASPLIDGNLLLVALGGKPSAGVVAFDLATGREVWRALEESATWSSPVLVSAGGARQLIVWMRQSVTSLNPTNGVVFWREPTVSGGSPGFSAVSTPVLQGDRLLVSGLMFQLDPTRPTAKVLWPETTSGTRRILSDTSTPLFQGDSIYSPRSGGLFVCLDAATGKERWQTNSVTKLQKGACVHLTPNGSSLFLFTDQGDLIQARLSPESYTELGRAHLIDPTSPLFEGKFSWSAPAFANRNLYVRNDREIRCYSLAARLSSSK